MNRKGLDNLPMSTVIWIVALLVFLLIAIMLYVQWQGTGTGLADKIASLFP